ncbi:MAG TPA: hypothetical protein VF941_10095 [Clostridia bacterium]
MPSSFIEKQLIKKLIRNVEKFQLQQYCMQVMLCTEIAKNLLGELMLEEDAKGLLSGQIVNYYSGYDVEEQLKTMMDPKKSKIEKIKSIIAPKAEELLASNYSLRQLIVYTLRMDIMYMCVIKGEDYLQSDEKRRKELILIKFGAEFSHETNPEFYDEIFTNYFKVYVFCNKQFSIFNLAKYIHLSLCCKKIRFSNVKADGFTVFALRK